MSSLKPFAVAASTIRARLRPSLENRGSGGNGPSRWVSPGHEDWRKGFRLQPHAVAVRGVSKVGRLRAAMLRLASSL
ncbi:hypothetical protein PHJA_002535800 [Phtheirospermum japonicum]|uniref:Uncharacterized protein n=1 Tax=Phtheirospermum japonicum TaxID=374723 RepID=A0A830CY01_9LAMI|nr:hypothetical protein PHJA_002535800 [Phtheirospermum japonicum]